VGSHQPRNRLMTAGSSMHYGNHRGTVNKRNVQMIDDLSSVDDYSDFG
jgi:hypothetical protein